MNKRRTFALFRVLLTAGDFSVRERQQRGVQRMLSVSEDGIPPVHLLHDVRVHTVLLRGREDVKSHFGASVR